MHNSQPVHKSSITSCIKLADPEIASTGHASIHFLHPIDVVFGMHVTNSYNGAIAVKAGPAMASAEAFRINIKGKQSHGSTPWSSNDPIMAAFDIGTSLQTILSRRIDIRENPAVISVGIVKAGSRNNIIPESAMLEGTIRTFDKDISDLIHTEMITIATNIAKAHNVEASVEFAVYGSYPVTVNNPDLVKNYSKSLIEASDGLFSSNISASTGAEDFAYFLHKKFQAYIFGLE